MSRGDDAPRLTAELLEELEGRWRDLGVPIAEQLRSGLSREQIHVLTAPLDLHVPSEALVWWGWHDGAVGGTAAGQAFPGWWLPSLAEAVARARWELNEAVGLAGERAQTLLWRSSWLPIMSAMDGNYGAVDCSLPPDLPSPVFYTDRESVAKFEPRVPSIGTLICWWIDAIDTGVTRFDTATARWRHDPKRLDDQRARSGLL